LSFIKPAQEHKYVQQTNRTKTQKLKRNKNKQIKAAHVTTIENKYINKMPGQKSHILETSVG
jgi:hypothetical protein